MSVSPASTCPSLEQLEQLVSGQLRDERLRRHLSECESCRAQAAELRSNNELLAGFRVNTPKRPQSAPPTTAEDIEGYELGAELHQGGQGVVYEAVHKATKRRVALKMLKPGALGGERQRRRFEREIELVAAMRHPHIVTLYDSGATFDGRQYFAMELIRGRRLDEFVRDQPGDSFLGRDAIVQRLRLFSRICEAVQYAHQRGIIHRDLKPGNILVVEEEDEGDRVGSTNEALRHESTKGGGASPGPLRGFVAPSLRAYPKILDFGVAKALREDSKGAPSATQAGEFMGTFAYAAPEQVEGRVDQIDTRADVYSLGVILFEMLAGASPYPVGGTIPEVITSITQVTPPPPSTLRPGLDDDLDTIVLKALEKERGRRYQSAESLRQDIERYLRGEPIDAKRDSTWYVLKKTVQRHRGPVAVAVGFVLMIAALAVVMAVSARRTARERDKAIDAEHRAAQTAGHLAVTLSESNVERGRLIGLSGNVPFAEDLMWREFLMPPRDQRVSEIAPAPSRPVDSAAFWALWELYAANPCLLTRSSPGRAERGSCMLPRGDVLVSWGLEPGWFRWHSVPSLAPLRDWQSPGDHCMYVFVSPDQTLHAIGVAPDGTILLRLAAMGADWSAPRAERFILKGAPKFPSGMAASADGRVFVTWGDGSPVQIWNSRDGSLISSVDQGPAAEVQNAALSPDGRILATGAADEMLRFWRLPEGICEKTLRSVRRNFGFRVSTMRFNPSGDRLIVGGGDGAMEWWRLDTGECESRDRPHGFKITSLDFSPDGRRMLTASQDKTIILWDVASRTAFRKFAGHAAGAVRAKFTMTGDSFISSSIDGTMKLWDLRSDAAVARLRGHSGPIFGVDFSADGSVLASVGGEDDSTVRLWDVARREPIKRLSGHVGAVACVAISGDGRTIASGGYDGHIRLWSIGRNEAGAIELDGNSTILKGHDRQIFGVAWSPDGRLLASAGMDQTVRVWDVGERRCVRVMAGHTDRIPTVSFSHDGRLIASGSVDGSVRLWNASSGASQRALLGHTRAVRCVAFGHDDRFVWSCGDDSTARQWDVASGRCIAVLGGHEQDIFAIAPSADGRLVATAARGGAIKLWSAADGKCLTTLLGHDQGVFSLAFSPDGRTLASGGEDRDVRLWDLTYFDRHIAGNLEYQLGRLSPGAGDPDYLNPLKAWSANLLSPWTQISGTKTDRVIDPPPKPDSAH